nr:MAG TPA: minor structural protein [Caudoviricetes sp.]
MHMALTVKMLKGLGLTDEQREAVLEEHARTVDEIKVERDRLKKDAEKLITVQKELDDLKAADDGGWEEKAKGWEKKYTDLVAENKSKETRAAKEAAVKAYYEGKGITGDNLTIAMMGSGEAIEKLELDGDKIKDAAALDALVGGAFAKLVSTTTTEGLKTQTPPKNGGGKMTREEIVKIQDPVERRAAIRDNMELFEKG